MLSKNRLPVQPTGFYPPDDNSSCRVPSRKKCLKKNLALIKNDKGWFNLVQVTSKDFERYNLC